MKIFAVMLSLLLGLGLPALSLALTLDEAKAQGLVGEKADGFVAAVAPGPAPDVQALVGPPTKDAARCTQSWPSAMASRRKRWPPCQPKNCAAPRRPASTCRMQLGSGSASEQGGRGSVLPLPGQLCAPPA